MTLPVVTSSGKRKRIYCPNLHRDEVAFQRVSGGSRPSFCKRIGMR
ncbi:hypothetical protein [Rhodococcus sp. WB9]|nr:hypothetical protein [Rhodococcus sp. WB9]